MSVGVVWTVFCLGLGLIIGAETSSRGFGYSVLGALGAACIFWAAGVGLWMLVGAVV